MAAGSFELSYLRNSEGRKIGIQYAPTRPGEKVPVEQTDLAEGVNSVILTLQTLFPDGGEVYDNYFEDAYSLADWGLVGKQADPVLALSSLRDLKSDILHSEAGKVKNRHLMILGKWALLFAVTSFVAGVVMNIVQQKYPSSVVKWFVIGQFCYAWAATMAGAWVSYCWRKANFTFEDLGMPEEDRLAPPFRLVFTGLMMIMIGLLFTTGWVKIEFGNVGTGQFGSSVEIAVLIGLFCGSFENNMPAMISKQASALFQNS